MLKVYEITKDLFISGTITPGSEEDVASKFGLIISLIKPSEISYDVSVIKERGCEVISVPIDVYSLPTVLVTYDLVSRIKYVIRGGGRVLIHCRDGKSRSCALAAAYLIVEEGLSSIDALTRVKLIRGSILISDLQLRRLKLLEYLVNRLGCSGLRAIHYFGSRFNYGDSLPHASQTLEISYYLIRELGKDLSMSKTDEVVTLIASALHDVGRKYGEYKHDIRSYELIRDSIELYSAFGYEIRDAVAWVARFHRVSSGNPLECNELNDIIKWCVARATAIVRVANTLASNPRYEVINVLSDIDDSCLNVRIEWINNVDKEFLNVINKSLTRASELLTNILGVNDLRIYHEEVYLG